MSGWVVSVVSVVSVVLVVLVVLVVSAVSVVHHQGTWDFEQHGDQMDMGRSCCAGARTVPSALVVARRLDGLCPTHSRKNTDPPRFDQTGWGKETPRT
jgi:hypothetical protein